MRWPINTIDHASTGGRRIVPTGAIDDGQTLRSFLPTVTDEGSSHPTNRNPRPLTSMITPYVASLIPSSLDPTTPKLWDCEAKAIWPSHFGRQTDGQTDEARPTDVLHASPIRPLATRAWKGRSMVPTGAIDLPMANCFLCTANGGSQLSFCLLLSAFATRSHSPMTSTSRKCRDWVTSPFFRPAQAALHKEAKRCYKIRQSPSRCCANHIRHGLTGHPRVVKSCAFSGHDYRILEPNCRNGFRS